MLQHTLKPLTIRQLTHPKVVRWILSLPLGTNPATLPIPSTVASRLKSMEWALNLWLRPPDKRSNPISGWPKVRSWTKSELLSVLNAAAPKGIHNYLQLWTEKGKD